METQRDTKFSAKLSPTIIVSKEIKIIHSRTPKNEAKMNTEGVGLLVGGSGGAETVHN